MPQGDPTPLLDAPPAQHERLPQFQPAGEVAAAAKAGAGEPVDDAVAPPQPAAEDEAAAPVQDPPSPVSAALHLFWPLNPERCCSRPLETRPPQPRTFRRPR